MPKFNVIGLVLLAWGGAFAGIGSLLLRLPDQPVMMAVGGVMFIGDVAMRLRSRATARWFPSPQLGGLLFSLLVWILGALVFAVVSITGARP